MERVAVIVPVYNGERHLPATLDAILAQTYKDFHLVVVNDGSTDATAAILQQHAGRPGVTCLSQPNRGQAAAINHGLRLGRQPLVAVCDADDLWRPDRLARVVPSFDAEPGLGMVCNDYASGEDPARPWVSVWESRRLRPVSGQAFDRLLEVNFIQRSAVVLQRADLDRWGGFSETVGGKCGFDDWDMWLKIAHDHKVLCLPEVLTFKRCWEGQDSGRLHYFESGVRLWHDWADRLRDEGRRYRQARANLGEAYFELGYTYLKGPRQRRAAGAALWRAARFGYRPLRCLTLIGAAALRLA